MPRSAGNLVWLNLCQQLASVIGFPACVIACVIYVPCVHLVCTEAWPVFASLSLCVCCCWKRPVAAQVWLQLPGTAEVVIAVFYSCWWSCFSCWVACGRFLLLIRTNVPIMLMYLPIPISKWLETTHLSLTREQDDRRDTTRYVALNYRHLGSCLPPLATGTGAQSPAGSLASPLAALDVQVQCSWQDPCASWNCKLHPER